MQSPSTFTVPTVAAVASALERAARIAAPLICWAIAAVMTAAHLAYQLGHGLGQAVHHRNDQLAAVARRLATGERQARPTHVVPVPAPIAPQAPQEPQQAAPTPARVVPTPAPLLSPLAALRDELSALTVAELRRITGTRRKARKAELVMLALVMA